MEISLSTHLFVFNDIDETIASLFQRFGFSSAELWAMPPHFPYGDIAESDRLAHHGGGTMVVHTTFPAEKWYPYRWAAFLSSMNELLSLVPENVRFAVENTPLASGRSEVILDIVDRYPRERVGVCID